MAAIVESESFDPFPIGTTEDTSIHTPTRFLLHCFSESLTPSFGSRYGFEEMNPFEQNFIEGPTAGDRMISVNMNMPTYVPGALSYPSPNSPPSNTSFDESSKSSPPAIRSAARAKTTIFKSQGPENFQPPKGAGGSKYKTLKHKISIEEDDDEEDMEMKRLKFLERNRQAALKCRQKKKQWEKELQVRSEEVMKENKTLRIAVQDLKEEALMLKHQLLSHSDCDCTVIRDYLAKATHSNFTLRPVMDLSQKPRC